MNSRRLKLSEDHQSQTILGGHSSDGQYSEPIPIDLVIEIFLRLSVKSIARCRCVSKIWSCIFRCPYFTDLFLTKSSACPQLLLASAKDSELFFFSSPPVEVEKQSHIATKFHIKLPFVYHVENIFSPISGLVCIKSLRMIINNGTKKFVRDLVICNPSTGQSFTLPKLKKSMWNFSISFFGYDPIEKQFKVLSVTWWGSRDKDNDICKKHQVLTLGGTEKVLSWKPVECDIPHYCPKHYQGVCINGVLYYGVGYESSKPMIVCFDVRSEKCSFIEITKPFHRVVHPAAKLINYKGKLASIILESSQSFEMWVLEDPIKHLWTKHIYDLSLVENDSLYVVGVTAITNEIVMSPRYHNPSGFFYVFYFNFDTKTIRRVEIQGMEAFKGNMVYTLVDHVEDVKLMKMFSSS